MGLKQRRCPECGTVFELGPFAAAKMFCSDECRKRSYERNGMYVQPEVTFTCDWCGEKVTAGGTDKRYRFCSLECQKKYSTWKAKIKRQQSAKRMEWTILDAGKVTDIVNTHGWSMSGVSNAMGMSDGYIGAAVRQAAKGRMIKKETAEKIARGLDVDVAEIIKATGTL